MKVDVNAPYSDRIDRALGDDSLRTALGRATSRLTDKRADAMEEIDVSELRKFSRKARAHSIANLPDLLELLETNLKENGCTVHWAETAEDARRIVKAIAAASGAKTVVKSKSMLTEELKINDVLEADGIEVVETDLGEYIIQLAGEPPSHILAPGIHKRVEDISDLFVEKLGIAPTTDPQELCGAARTALRKKFLSAEMGISGGNFAVAETGTIGVITNEGNGRMVTTMPPVYVAIVGIEKVIATMESAVQLWQAAARNATGQHASVYFSLTSGPKHDSHADGPKEVHVVLVDNGRSRIVERGYADALLCIRCSACVNVCPVYREIGGHAYGDTPYSGPIGAVITPLLSDDPASVCELPFASTLCGLCKEVCPVEIDLPRMLIELRGDAVKRASPWQNFRESTALKSFAWIAQKPILYRGVQRMTALTFKIPFAKKIQSLVLGRWMQSRTLPPTPNGSFRSRWRERQRKMPAP